MADGGYDVGDQPMVQFVFIPHALHPLAESTAVTITVHRPDGTTFGTYTEADEWVTRDVETGPISGVTTAVTTYVLEFPEPFDVGSKRNPWRLRAQSTAGLLAAVEAKAWVRVPSVT